MDSATSHSRVGLKDAVRVPTVNEALPFTPFTCVVPFDPAIITAPSCTKIKSKNISTLDANTLKRSRSVLSQLSAGADRAENASERCQKTIHEVRRMLHTNNLTHFKLRKFPYRSAPPEGLNTSTRTVKPPRLSSFARMMLAASQVELQYNASTLETSDIQLQNGNSHEDRRQAMIQAHSTELQHKKSEQISTVQHPPIDDIRPERITAPDSVVQSTVRFDQKAKGQAVLLNLSSLLDTIFAADDAINSGAQLNNEILSIFRFSDTTEGVVHLSQAYQVRLEHAMDKVAKAFRLHDIPTTSLKKIQRLCDDLIKLSVETDLQLADDTEEWQQRLTTIESALLASRVSLRIMAHSTDRELQSEESVRAMVDVMHKTIECIISVAERSIEPHNAGETLRLVLRGYTKALRLLGDLLAKINIDESALSGVIYMCRLLIFAENTGAVDWTTFEGSRRHAMDVLAKVFDKQPSQRQFIFDEILLSLEKLPATKQSARNFQLTNSKPIQLVSALIMQLIQTSTVRAESSILDEDDDNDDAAASGDEDDGNDQMRDVGEHKDLATMVAPYQKAALNNAIYITSTLVQRALNTAKSAEEPHRKLLDIFTEDFAIVLAIPEWPAAELLLRCLLMQMIAITEKPKSTVQHRNFALESIGKMGCAILQVQSQASTNTNGIDGNAKLADNELLSIDGPYRKVIDFLHDKTHDTRTQTAISYHLVHWAYKASLSEKCSNQVSNTLSDMLVDTQWFEKHDSLDSTIEGGRHAALTIAIHSPFCQAFNKIFNILITNMSSEQSTVKSRAIRSLLELVQSDPTVLRRNAYILKSILHCSEDNSTLVRDAALGLISKCVIDQPVLEARVYDAIITRSKDAAIGIRKRAIKMLKEIFIKHSTYRIGASAAIAICTSDIEESVADAARSLIEEIWFQPFYNSGALSKSDADIRMAVQARVGLWVQVVESDDAMPDILSRLLQYLLEESKSSQSNRKVVEALVEQLFDTILDVDAHTDQLSPVMLLQTVAVFAQACPSLLTPSQLEMLEPYTRNLISDADLSIFHLALTILRHTMPYVTGLRHDFMANVQKALLGTLGKLPNSEFEEVAICLSVLDSRLGNTTLLVTVLSTALKNVRALSKGGINQDQSKKILRFLCLIGELGKACDLEHQYDKIKANISDAKSDTVAGIIVETLVTYTSARMQPPLQLGALEAICSVCQRWPKQFLRIEVLKLFDAIFNHHLVTHEDIMLRGLLSFFSGQESVSVKVDEGATGRERLAKTYVATDQDGAASSLSQRYLNSILKLATASLDDSALTATKLVASIVRQGLPHPKECGPSLIALETSPNVAIAQLACAEHRTMHEKHETIIEKEYMRAMDRALLYQQQVVKDGCGWTRKASKAADGSEDRVLVAKLYFFWDVLRSGKAKVRQKYLNNICLKLSAESATHDHLAFVRFMVENLALFEFDKIEDIRLLAMSLSKAFAISATVVAQAIDSEVFNMTVDSLQAMQMDSQNATHHVDKERLKALTLSAQILLIIEEGRAFLGRCWGQKVLRKEKSKDTKAPARANNTGALVEAFVKRTAQLAQSYDNKEAQFAMCREFTEVASTDKDVKVGSDAEDEDDDASSTGDQSLTPSRKRKSAVGTNGPRKRGKARKTPSFVQIDDEDAEGEWE